jgi:hypothetical protein
MGESEREMTSRIRRIRVGAIAWGILSFFAVTLPVLHAIPDLLFQLYDPKTNLTPAALRVCSFSFLTAGVLFEPIMILCIVLFAMSFLQIYAITRRRIALVNAILLLLYAAGRAFWAWADVNAALAVDGSDGLLLWSAQSISKASLFKGLAAAGNGLVATVLTVALMVYFRGTESAGWASPGFVGTIIILGTVVPSIAVKTATLWYRPELLTAVFLLLMTAKSIGIALTALAVYGQSTEYVAGPLTRDMSAARG